MPLNRIEPNMPAGQYKTYQLAAPRGTHFRAATCVDVDCAAFRNGWRTVVDESTDIGQRQAGYIRTGSRRSFTEYREGTLTVFLFPAGQGCFAAHQMRLDRPPLYIVRDGDWRGNPRGTQPRYHARPENWVEDFQEHQQTLSEQLQKG